MRAPTERSAMENEMPREPNRQHDPDARRHPEEVAAAQVEEQVVFGKIADRRGLR